MIAVDPQIAACGPSDTQSWLCSFVYDVTDNTRTAEIADKFSKPVRGVAVVLVAYLVVRLVRLVTDRSTERIRKGGSDTRFAQLKRKTGFSLLDTGSVASSRRVQRAETIGAVVRSVTSLLVWMSALLTILAMMGINLAPIVAGAGVVGVALGFGAQTLVRDFIAGLFMLFEGQFGVGDSIDAGFATGVVEGVSLRTTRLRDLDGVVWHIPNGEIRRVGNQSQQWSRAVVDVTVTYEADVDEVIDLIGRIADALGRDPTFGRLIVDEAEVLGVETLGDDRIVLRTVVRTQPQQNHVVARELRRRLKDAFEAADIPVPGVRLTEAADQTSTSVNAPPARPGGGADE